MIIIAKQVVCKSVAIAHTGRRANSPSMLAISEFSGSWTCNAVQDMEAMYHQNICGSVNLQPDTNWHEHCLLENYKAPQKLFAVPGTLT